MKCKCIIKYTGKDHMICDTLPLYVKEYKEQCFHIVDGKVFAEPERDFNGEFDFKDNATEVIFSEIDNEREEVINTMVKMIAHNSSDDEFRGVITQLYDALKDYQNE